MFTIEDYRSAIFEKVKHLDIGMLILNAGIMKHSTFALSPDRDVEAQMNVNMLQVTYTAKVLIQKMLDRFDAKGKKSAILITSSILNVLPVPTIAVYCANKGFATMFGQALHPEVKGKIDVLCFNAGTMATKMLGEKPSLTVISSEMAATACF